MIISDRKIRFKIKILILNIFFFIYNFLPNRRLKNFFILPNQTNVKIILICMMLFKSLQIKKKVKKILEIGIGGHDLDYQGGASLLAMNFFFRKSQSIWIRFNK